MLPKITDAEMEEARHAAAEYINKLASVMRGENRECLHCGVTVERYVRRHHCVYAEPCEHRQWNGNLPKV